jgi:hypothetical protein
MEMNGRTPPKAPDCADAWRGLYRAGAAAALIAVLVFRRNCGTELVALSAIGLLRVAPATHPVTALEWFTLIQDDRWVGLILLNLFDLVNYALVGLIFLALYGALCRAHESAMIVATTCALVGVGVFFASNQAFAMLSLSDRWAAATTETERSTLLAAGEALLAIDNPGAIFSGTGIYASLFLVALAGLIASVAMLRGDVFGKTTAYVGLAANVLLMGQFLALAFAPSLLAIPPSLSAPFRVAWYVLIALRLLRLASGGPKEAR